MKLAILLTLGIGILGAAGAPDVEGRWIGTLQPADGSAAEPILLTVSRMGDLLSGSLTYQRDSRATPFFVDLQGSTFTLTARDPAGRTVTFHLSVSDSGISGDATAGSVLNKVSFPREQRTDIPPATRQASPPVLISKTEPEYTEQARQAKLQGTVLLQVVISANGEATQVRVLRSLGMGLDEKAFDCVQKWRFKPAIGLDGKPTSTPATLEVNFRL